MKIDYKKIIVFWGVDEKKFLKKEFTKYNITVHHLKGGHRHIDVKPVIDEINERIKEEWFSLVTPFIYFLSLWNSMPALYCSA